MLIFCLILLIMIWDIILLDYLLSNAILLIFFIVLGSKNKQNLIILFYRSRKHYSSIYCAEVFVSAAR